MLTGLYVFVLLGIAASINLPSNKGWFKGSSRNDYQLKPVDCGNNNSTFVNNILTLFMPATYSVIFDDDDDVKHDEPKEFYVRQVPGDGSCLFHAVATCIKFVASNDNIKLYNNLIFFVT
jgi:hypothetical protein